MIAAPAKGADAPRTCGMVTWNVDGQRHLRMIDVTMGQIANYLSGTGAASAGGNLTPRSGVDGTGLSGRFDVDIQFMPETEWPGRQCRCPWSPGIHCCAKINSD